MVKKLFFAFVLSISIFGLSSSLAATDTKEYMFTNGLKLVVREDHRAPIVISQIWYKVGSSYEKQGVTGISHMLEHMMFKGTEKYPNSTLLNLVSEVGGKQNAFTSKDFTAYYQELNKDDLELSFRLESDRMKNLVLQESDLLKEREVVAEERRMRTENIPANQLFERFNAIAQIGSPYHHPIIGWMQDINHYNLDDLKTWYKTYYSPNNAVLVVVGDVEPDAVYEMAKKHFENIGKEHIPAVKTYKSFENIGKREIEVKLPTKVSKILIGFNVPSLNTAEIGWEPYALDILTNILTTGESSRLESDLVRKKQIAASVNASYENATLHDAVLYLSGMPGAKSNLVKLKQGLLSHIDKLKNELVTDEELKRVKINVIADNVYKKDSMFYQALEIGILESIGKSWKFGEEYIDKVNAITKEQVLEVAKKYLQPDRMTVAFMQAEDNKN